MASCKHPDHRPWWRVVQRRCNFSAFNGYHQTPSDYSQVRCFAIVNGGECSETWRSKGAFVDELPDAPPGWRDRARDPHHPEII